MEKLLYRLEYFENNQHPLNSVNQLSQFNLESTKNDLSKTFLPEKATYLQSIQMGPNNKLYLVDGFQTDQLCEISDPNKVIYKSNNNLCGYTTNSIVLSKNGTGGVSRVGLPSFQNNSNVNTIPLDFMVRTSNCKTINVVSNQSCLSQYLWEFGDGNTSTDEEPSHTYSSFGTYTVKLIGNNDTIAQVIKIGIDSSYYISGDTTFCDTTALLNFNLPFNPFYTYDWNTTNTIYTSESNNTIECRFSSAGTVSVKVTDPRTGCEVFDTISSKPGVPIGNNVLINIFPKPCKADTSFTITGSNPTGGFNTYSYQWYESADSNTWALRSGDNTQSLNIKSLPNSTTWYYRKVNSHGCYSISPSTKVTPIVVSNNTIEITKDNCFEGAHIVATGSEPTLNDLSYEFVWQYSTDNISYYNFSAYSNDTNDLKKFDDFIENGKVFLRRIIYTSSYCYDTSNIDSTSEAQITVKKQPKNYYTCVTGGFDPSVSSSKTVKFQIRLNNPHSESVQYFWEVAWDGTSFDTLGQSGRNRYTDTNYSFSSDYQFGASGSYPVRCRVETSCETLYSNTVVLTYNSSTTAPTFNRYPREDTFAQEGAIAIISGHSNNTGINYLWTRHQKILGSPNYGSKYDSIYNPMTWEMDSILEVTDFSICDPNPKYFYKLKIDNGCKETYSTFARVYGSKTEMYIRDFWTDNGREPDTFSLGKSYTHSPDMWISHGYDSKWLTSQPNHSYTTHQMLSSQSDTNWLWTKITNRGTDTTREAKLWLYWTKASTGELWDWHWTEHNGNRHYNSLDNNYYKNGARVNATTITIPPIAPGEYFTDAYPWPQDSMPQSSWYNYLSYDPNTQNWDTVIPMRIGVCFLSRIEICDSSPFGMTYPEQKYTGLVGQSGFFKENVLNNNKIATNNTYLGQFGAGFRRRQSRVLIRNISDTIDQLKVGIHCNNPAYFNGAKLLVRFDHDLWNYWTANGSQGTGFVVMDTGLIQAVNSDSIILEGILLDTNQYGSLSLEFELDSLSMQNLTGNNEIVRFDVMQQSMYENSPQGWVQIYLDAPMATADGGKEGGGAGSIRKDTSNTGLNIHKDNKGTWAMKKYTYIPSDILPMQLRNKPFVKVFPNPNNGSFKIGILSDYSSSIDVSLMDNNGKTITRTNPNIGKGLYQELQYTNRDITEGAYHLNIKIDGKVFNVKIVVVK